MHADRMMTQSGVTSSFGSGIGMARNLISCVCNFFSCGSPMYGTRDTRATANVDRFNAAFGAT